MAATRLIALHKNKGKSVAACLKSRTDYAQNPDKTQQGELVSSYECSPLTVDEEFMLSKRQYELMTGRRQKNDVIAYQIRQSFKPGEITAEEANKVGYELAMRFTKGKYAFIVATHTDREHIHNHIIYNSTALDSTRKFRDFLLSGLAVQRLSDLICLEHLQEKNDFYYIVLSYKDADGKRKTKWEATGLSVKRNKKKAEALLLERRRNFMVPTAPAEIRLDDDILFSDFMLKWLEVTKSSVQITTYASYQGMVERIIAPYFRKRGIKLVDLKATDLQDFYTKQLERVKANSVIHYHANIHKALKYAVKIDLIPTNPADKVERPKKNAFKGSYYSAEEIHALTEVAEGTKLEIPVLLASFYGLRRSEVLGLKWDAIDFEENTLEIKHIVTQASIDGKKVLVQADRAKTKSSLRTLPLVPPIRDRLLMLKGQQETYRRLCGKSYNRDYLGYLCVDEIGNIIRPNYVSEQFPKLLEKNGLRPIRFHDLRHSCASLLLANGVPMKQIQEWLGHSDFSTTANIYAHLDYASKLSSAQAMLEGLGYGNASA